MIPLLFAGLLLLLQNPPAPPKAPAPAPAPSLHPGQAPSPPPGPPGPLDRSGAFAFVDREYIFTLEMVKPGIPMLNFVSMSDKERVLSAKLVRITLESRKVPGKFFMVDTGNPKEPVIVPSVRVRPRSSFGVRLQGEFGEQREVAGVTIGIGEEDFRLVPLASLDFENLALKINRLNLGSPDFRDDWRVLKLEVMGERVPARRPLP
jgi:hypothetical protein